MVVKHQKLALDLSTLPVTSTISRRPRRLLQNHHTLFRQLQLQLCVAGSALILLAMAWWRDGQIKGEYRTMAVIAVLLMLVVYEWRGVFRRNDGAIFRRLVMSWSLVVAGVISMTFFAKTSNEISRIVIFSWALMALTFQILVYQISLIVARKLRHQYGRPVRAVVLGSTKFSEHLVNSINNNSWMPDQIIGVVDDSAKPMQAWNQPGIPHLGTFSELVNIIDTHRINRVYLALPVSCSQVTERIYRDIAGMAVDVIWVPDIFGMQLLNHSVRELNGLPLITLSESPIMSEIQLFRKTLVDKVIASLALLFLSPLMGLIALLVWRSSPGPIFFKQQRHGWDGQIIEVWKFRSMYVHQDSGVQQASRNDSRITPVGRVLRRMSLDELPQLFNVIGGSMSLVGPRPHAIEHNGFYSQYIRSYMLRHRIKPGMTGLAQVKGFRGETETLTKMLARVEQDIEYINSWSIWLDLKILFQTPFSLLSKNAY